MYVNLAVLAETRPRERRVALVPALVPKLVKLGAKLHMQTGAGLAVHLQPLSAINDIFKRLAHGEVPSRVVLYFASR